MCPSFEFHVNTTFPSEFTTSFAYKGCDQKSDIFRTVIYILVIFAGLGWVNNSIFGEGVLPNDNINKLHGCIDVWVIFKKSGNLNYFMQYIENRCSWKCVFTLSSMNQQSWMHKKTHHWRYRVGFIDLKVWIAENNHSVLTCKYWQLLILWKTETAAR